MKWKDTSSKGLVLVGVLLILLMLAAYSMVRLNSVILQVGTSRWIQLDAMADYFTKGGANEILSTGLKNPGVLVGTLEYKNYTLDVNDLGTQYIGNEGMWDDSYSESNFIFPKRHIHPEFFFRTTTPMIAGGVPGFEEGKYCNYRYIVQAEGRLQLMDTGEQDVRRHLVGEFVVGPMLCR